MAGSNKHIGISDGFYEKDNIILIIMQKNAEKQKITRFLCEYITL